MRIAMLGHKTIPHGFGGTEAVVEALAVRFAQKGHEVTCYNRAEGQNPSVRTYRGVRLVTVPTVRVRGLAALSSSVFAAIRAAFGRYDVVHFHSEGPACMCFLPKLFGKKTVVTVHGLDHQRAKWGRLAGRYILRGEKNAVRYADTIIVLSRNVQRYFLEKYGRETVCIPNGTEPCAHREAAEIREKFGLTADGYILFLGRLVPEKGLEYLIRAFREIETDKQLIIAGSSSDTDAYTAEMQALAADDGRIRFIGWADGDCKQELFCNAYCYVLPSDLEGMPLSLLEAMACGCCCLCSDIPECAEVIGTDGVLFRHGDTDDLREKLQMLCAQPETVQAYRERALENAAQKLSWDAVADRTLACYTDGEVE